jgi:adenylate cyclase
VLERKLTAILCADVFGYSRLMGEDEEATLRTLSAYRKIIDRLIENHRGRFVNSAGDSVLAEFLSVVEAVNCSIEIQNALKAENTALAPERRMEFRIGINLGDVMVEGEQIYGDGVNVAARLENLADPGGICISGIVHDQVKGKLTLSYQDLGIQQVKNITEPVHVWRVVLDDHIRSRRTAARFSAKSYWRGGVLSLAGLAIIIGTFLIVQHLSFKPPRTSASIPAQDKPTLPVPNIPSIAVLPFINLSGDPGQEYFSDGLTDQLINELSRLQGLFVIARNSSFAYKRKPTSEQTIGHELGVRYLLEGSAQKSAEQIRIGVELVDAVSGAAMWAQTYERPFKDIFAVQDEIVGRVVATLNLIFKLDALKAPHLKAPRTDNLDALDDLLRSYGYWSRFDKGDHLRAREWCEKAIDADPSYAQAYSCLAGNYSSGVLFGWSENSEADLKRAVELSQKALALDDSDSSALTVLCAAHWMQRDYDEAVDECQRAVTIDPNSSNAYLELSDALAIADRPQEAMRAAKKAMRLDPTRASFYAYFIASAYIMMGRYQEAVPLLKDISLIIPISRGVMRR